jgi:glyoxylase-like metal-dependent hydrolase (beta-lactamase superfamily II)
MSDFKASIIPVTPFQQNCTILWNEESKSAAIIDPGGDVGRILEAVAKLAVRPEKILLTHGHIDHAGGAAALKEALGGVPIEGPDERDLFLLEGLQQQGRGYGMDARNVVPDRWLKEGENVTVAGLVFQVLHCPGHTPGHLVFFSEAMRFALVGDVLFRGSVGRTDFPYGDSDALIASITAKLLPLGDDVAFICGHGPGSTIGVERQANPFLRPSGSRNASMDADIGRTR